MVSLITSYLKSSAKRKRDDDDEPAIISNDDKVQKKDKLKKKKKQEKREESLFNFETSPILDKIELDDECSLEWCKNYLSKEESDALYEHCLNTLNFEHSKLKMYGKEIPLPRIQSWFADEGLVVKDLYQKQKQHPWTPIMMKLKNQLEKQLGCKFEYCLVNLYRNGKDHIGYHQDKEVKGTVASVSVGTTRTFWIQHLSEFKNSKVRGKRTLTKPKDKSKYEFKLSHGSMVAMLGGTQFYWKHMIVKEPSVTTQRINLTFRTW